LTTYPLHPGGSDLHDQVVAETVHHQAGQQVGLTVNQTIEMLFEEFLPQAQSNLDAMHQQRFVQRMRSIAAVQSGTDKVVRADRSQTKHFAGGRLELNFLAHFQSGKRGLGDIDFVAEDPQVAALDSTITVGLEAQAGQTHHELLNIAGWNIPPVRQYTDAAALSLRLH